MQCTRQAACPSVDRHPRPPTATLCQMSQNDCYDSQGHWENSSAAGLSAQMSPAVTPGGLQTLPAKTVCSNTYTLVPWLLVVTVRRTALTLKMFYRQTGCTMCSVIIFLEHFNSPATSLQLEVNGELQLFCSYMIHDRKAACKFWKHLNLRLDSRTCICGINMSASVLTLHAALL